MPSRGTGEIKQISKGSIGYAKHYLLESNRYKTIASKNLTEHTTEVAVKSLCISGGKLSAGIETRNKAFLLLWKM